MAPMSIERQEAAASPSSESAAAPAAGKAKSPAAGNGGARAAGAWGIYAVLAVIAGFVAGFISWFFLADSLAALGIPDPGRLTTVGLPFLRAAAWMCMALSVGSFMVSAFFVSPLRPREPGADRALNTAPLSVDGHIAARTGGIAALIVAAIAVVEAPLVMSDLTGTPLRGVLNADMFSLALSQIATAQVWLITAVIAALVGIGGLVSRKWGSQPPLFIAALIMVIPLGMEGHSAAGGDHDYGTNSFLWHLVFLVIWVGGLMGLLAHARRLGPDLTVAVRRYSTLALVAIVVMSISGVINALIRVEPQDWFSTRYGLIIVTKVALTLVLGLCGFAHRQLTIPHLESRPELFRRVAFVELAVMAATVGVAGTMGRTPPPPPRDPNLNAMQIFLGYELEKAPTVFNVWGMFRFDILFGTLGLILAGLYLYALYRLRRQGKEWPVHRTVWWLVGSMVLTIVMSTGIGMYMPAMYSMHMLNHMILSMVVPIGLVLGAPLTLIMEAFPDNPANPGLHEWAKALTQSRALKWVTHPAVNLIQFLVVFYAIYMSFDFYEFAISEHAGHVIMNGLFLVSGYIYFWEVIGTDPLPRRAETRVRLFILFISMPIHLFAGVYLMQLGAILGEDFYLGLNLPWEPDLYQDQRVGGGIAWGFNQFPLALVFAYLFIGWLRDDRRAAKTHDEQADLDGDADLEDYNAMLAALNADDARHSR